MSLRAIIPKAPPLTIALVVVSIAVYVLMTIALGMKEVVMRLLLISEYVRPTLPEISQGEIWRLLTPIFLHFSIFHIVFNMLWTWELGRLIEWRQGAGLLMVLTAIVATVSNLAQYFMSGPLFGGMSGVIYGYFGYVWIQSLVNPGFGIRLNPAIVKVMLGWFVICWTGILEKLFGLGIANTAHTAGLISGIIMALIVAAWIRITHK